MQGLRAAAQIAFIGCRASFELVRFQIVPNLSHIDTLGETQRRRIAPPLKSIPYTHTRQLSCRRDSQTPHTGDDQRQESAKATFHTPRKLDVRQSAETVLHLERLHPALRHQPIENNTGHEPAGEKVGQQADHQRGDAKIDRTVAQGRSEWPPSGSR